jgi:hypothetical protein
MQAVQELKETVEEVASNIRTSFNPYVLFSCKVLQMLQLTYENDKARHRGGAGHRRSSSTRRRSRKVQQLAGSRPGGPRPPLWVRTRLTATRSSLLKRLPIIDSFSKLWHVYYRTSRIKQNLGTYCHERVLLF